MPRGKRKEKRCERVGGKQKEDGKAAYSFLFPTQKPNLPFLFL